MSPEMIYTSMVLRHGELMKIAEQNRSAREAHQRRRAARAAARAAAPEDDRWRRWRRRGVRPVHTTA